ncbi:PREDICTED: uncharacterized protein LOC105459731, partial [Wasmannia auropunctata]|uniref:uncharacterized protein LOC105459731 n=1 Tax=Wasmannia auropunctata TaxID=64793 RepID=UPI0005EDA09B
MSDQFFYDKIQELVVTGQDAWNENDAENKLISTIREQLNSLKNILLQRNFLSMKVAKSIHDIENMVSKLIHIKQSTFYALSTIKSYSDIKIFTKKSKMLDQFFNDKIQQIAFTVQRVLSENNAKNELIFKIQNKLNSLTYTLLQQHFLSMKVAQPINDIEKMMSKLTRRSTFSALLKIKTCCDIINMRFSQNEETADTPEMYDPQLNT